MSGSAESRPIGRRTVLVGGGAAVLAAGALDVAARRSRRPPRPELGVAVAGDSEASVARVARLGTALGERPRIATVFQAWAFQPAFPRSMVTAARARSMTPQVTWEPWDPRSGATQADYAAGGTPAVHDEYVEGFARDVALDGGVLNLRFAHEMNGTWYPWAVGNDRASASTYVAAHARVHRQFKAAGADAVAWTWCPNVMIGDQRDLLTRLYPGDDAVDVIGVDGYDRDGLLSPADLFGPTIDVLRRIAPDKPLWINETGSASRPGKPRWIRDLFAFARRSAIDAVVWFEVDDASTGEDWRLNESAATLQAARAALKRW